LSFPLCCLGCLRIWEMLFYLRNFANDSFTFPQMTTQMGPPSY
jgi:hypothetical protein